jgi:hypothetical protein
MALLLLVSASGDADAVTWEDEYTVYGPSSTADVDIVVEGNEVWVSYVRWVGVTPYAYLKHYDGTVWSAEVPVTGVATSIRDTVMEVHNGTVHFVYTDETDGDQDIYYTRWDGRAWWRSQQVSVPTVGVDSGEAAISVDDEKVHVAWSAYIDGDTDIYYRSYDGAYWSTIGKVNVDSADEEQYNVDVLSHEGAVHFVWTDYRDGDSDIYHRTFFGTRWGPVTEISADTDTEASVNPQIAASDMGVHVVYTTNLQSYAATFMTTLESGSWDTPLYVGRDSQNDHEYFPKVDAEGKHVIIMYRLPVSRSNIVFRHYNNGNWETEENIITSPENGHQYSYQEMALEGGTLHAVHVDTDIVARTAELIYKSADLDTTAPSAWIEVLDPYWQNTSRWSFDWYAGDDYQLTTVTFQYRYSADNATWSRWTELHSVDVDDLQGSGQLSFSPGDGDGHYQFKAYARDLTGKQEPASMEPEAMNGWDTVNPRGSVVIEGGAAYTNSTSVTLDLTSSDATSGVAKVRFGEDTIGGDEPWEDPVDTKRWTLGPEDGDYTVAYQVMDLSGRLSPVYTDSITLDTTDPYGTISMEVASDWTTGRDVDLALTYGDDTSGVTKVRFGDEAIGGDEPWEDPVDTKRWTLPDVEGAHTIAYQVLDAAGHTSEVYTLSVGLDTVAPTGSIIIEGGDTILTDTTVMLTLTAEDGTSGVAGIRVTNEAIGGDEPWEDPVEELEWELADEGGEQTVRYQVIDVAGLVSPVYTATVTLDMDDPTGAIALVSGAQVVNASTVDLDLSFADETSAIVGIRVTETAIGGDEPWDDPVEAMEFQLSEGDGLKTIYLQVMDEAGHESPVYSVSFTLDTTNPVVESTDPLTLAEKVPVDKVISVRFSEIMNADSVERAFSLTYLDGGVPSKVTGTFNWSPDGKSLTFTPLGDLKEGKLHTITITDDALDAADNSLFPPLVSTFTTVGDGDGGDGEDDGLLGGLMLTLVIVLVVVVATVLATIYYFTRFNADKGLDEDD